MIYLSLLLILSNLFVCTTKAWDETWNIVEAIEIQGPLLMSIFDLPTFQLPSNPYGTLSGLVVEQFRSLQEATWILGNSFQELELEEINSLELIDLISSIPQTLLTCLGVVCQVWGSLVLILTSFLFSPLQLSHENNFLSKVSKVLLNS